MPTVTIGSTDYPVYADVATADEYMAAKYGATWPTLSTAEKSQLLVTATRTLDRQCWLGEQASTSPAQELQWPRTGTGVTGVEDDTVPEGIVNGCIELAEAIVVGSTVQDNPTPGQQNISSLAAGSVSLAFFRGAEGALVSYRFPLVVQELVGRYMCGANGIAGVVASGTDGESCQDQDFGFNDGL